MASSQSLKQMLAAGESDSLDYKKTISSAQKIAKTLVAFANTKGGSLLIGVRDDGTPVGVESEEEAYMIESAANFYCKPIVEYTLVTHNYKGMTILEVAIPESRQKPHAALGDDNKWWVYIRVNDQSLLASKIVVDVLRKENSKEPNVFEVSSKEQALIDYLQKNQRITLKEYCKLINISRRRAMRILVALISAGIIRAHHTEKVEFYTLS